MSLGLMTGLALCAVVSGGNPVSTYTRQGEVTRGPGLRSDREFIPAADPQNGSLLNAEPYPSARTDDPRRPENGRLWYSRGPVGGRTALDEIPWGFPGAAGYGAPPEAIDEVIFVQVKEPLPVIAISPWENLSDDELRARIERGRPWIRRSEPRTRDMLDELRWAQLQWLKQQGFVQKVRTHVNAAPAKDEQQQTKNNTEPSAIIRIRKTPKVEKVAETAPAGEPTVIPAGHPSRQAEETGRTADAQSENG